ncbi:hypothetical protein KIL84_006324, partial [Mauremys mutica]
MGSRASLEISEEGPENQEDPVSSAKANAAVSAPTGETSPMRPVDEEAKGELGSSATLTSSATGSPGSVTVAMGEKSLKIICKKRYKLITIIQSDPESILDESLAQSITTDEDYDNMNTIVDTEAEIRKLLIQTQRKVELACQRFLECLETVFPGTNQDLQHPQWASEYANRYFFLSIEMPGPSTSQEKRFDHGFPTFPVGTLASEEWDILAAQGAEEGDAMEKAVSDCLHDSLEELTKDELKKFKFKLNTFKLKKGYDNIPMGKLEEASPVDLTRSILSYYGQDYGVEVTVNVLKSINRRDLAQKLSETLRPEFQLENESQHAVNPKAGELRASQSSILHWISSYLSKAICLIVIIWSSSDSALGATGVHIARATRTWQKRKKPFAVPCSDKEKALASANEEVLNLQQESETSPEPGEKDGLNQRLESEMQQDPEPRQKDDLNWEQESATQQDPELEETDLPK